MAIEKPESSSNADAAAKATAGDRAHGTPAQPDRGPSDAMLDDMTGHTPHHTPGDVNALDQQRHQLLQQLQGWLETPMLVLAFVWLALLIGELIWGASRLFETIGAGIWIVFIVDFAIAFVLAPRKVDYLKSNWLTALSLLVPALRIFRALRVFRLLRLARVGRGLRLLRVVSSMNRGMHALGASLSRRGFGYVLALSVLVTFAGAAGMYAFENEGAGSLDSYGEALWWTAMIMTTMGSQYWPASVEGRVLCVVLALYAFAVFGYVTATLATYFVGRDAQDGDAELPGANQLAEIQTQIAALRSDIGALSARLPLRGD